MIITERLRIIPFRTRHITTDYISWLNDKELMQYSEQRHYVHTMATCEAYVSSFEDSHNMFWAVKDLSGNLIGTITVYQDTQNRIVDMGIMLGDKSTKGKGFGYEAWKAAFEWVTQNMNPRKLTAGCMSVNIPMLKLMNSIEMQPDGVKKNHYIYSGNPVDVVYMAKFIDE